jgi:hypothetical protein
MLKGRLVAFLEDAALPQKYRSRYVISISRQIFDVTLMEGKGLISCDRFFAGSMLSIAEGFRMTFWAKPEDAITRLTHYQLAVRGRWRCGGREIDLA